MGLGGGKGQRSPTVDPNTLLSKTYAKILFLLCKGPVRGFVGAELGNAIKIDGVPLISPDGSQNFKGWEAFFRDGTPNQEYIPGLETNSQVTPVNSIVRKGIDVVRSINDPDADAVDVVIRIPALLKVESDGDVVGTTVRYAIDLQSENGPYKEVVNQTITDKSNTPYQRSHHIVLRGAAPWNVRVRRLTDDALNNQDLQNSTEWEYFALVEYEKRRYSGYCVVGLHIDVEQLDSLDSGSAEIEAQLVLCPHNYDPDARTYTGLFDGTMVLKWTNNPVWVTLDVLLSRIDLQSVRLYEFYEAAQYCDEEVNGEPRFTFNHVFRSRSSTFDKARQVASSFNGLLIPRGRKIGLIVDKPSDPTLSFDTDEMSAKPEYQIMSHLDISTVCTVTYQEPQQDYEKVSFVVRDEPGVERFGVREMNLEAVGCTSRGQAARTALWTLCSPRLNAAVVRFQLPLSGKLLLPGKTFTITDQRRDGLKASGRVLNAIAFSSFDCVEIDTPYLLDFGLEYTLSLIGGNGMLIAFDIDVERSIADIGDRTATQIYLSDENRVPKAYWPKSGDIWLIKPKSGKTGLPWQCRKATPVANKPSHYDVEAVYYDESKYEYVDTLGAKSAGNYSPREDSELLNPPGLPYGLSAISYYKISENGEVYGETVISWSYRLEDIPQLDFFELQHQKNGDPTWQTTATTKGRNYTLENSDNAVYNFRLSAVSKIGKRSEWILSDNTDNGFTITAGAPLAVSNLTAAKLDTNTVHLKWDESTTAAVRQGGFFRIRHSPLFENVGWQSGTLVAQRSGRADEATLPYQEGTYMIRTYNKNAVGSNVVAKVSTEFSSISDRTLLYSFDESPLFQGQKENTEIVGDKIRLALDLNNSEAFAEQGFYYFQGAYKIASTPQRFYLYPTVDVSLAFLDQSWASLDSYGSFSNVPMSVFLDPASAEFDQDYGEKPFAKIEVSISKDNEATYPDYFELTPGEFVGTDVKARLHFVSDRPNLSSEVRELSLLVLSHQSN